MKWDQALPRSPWRVGRRRYCYGLSGSAAELADSNAPTMSGRLSRLIERKLLENGFRRSLIEPDFYVSYHLAQRQHAVVVNEPRALYQLSSHHASPSFVIERSQQVTHVYRETRLSIAMARSGGGRLWHAAFRQDEREPRDVSPPGERTRPSSAQLVLA